jgi:tetratricopeptide (TPR) repeat protein
MRTPFASRLWFGLRFVLALSVLTGCFGHTPEVPDNRQLLEQGKRAYREGRILESYRILKQIPASDNGQGKQVKTLLARATQGTENLIRRWMEQGDFWIAQGNPARAVAYYRDLASQLPAADPLRQRFEERASQVEKNLATRQREVETLVAAAQLEFNRGGYGQARENLLKARWRAMEHNVEFSIENERLLAECERRLAGTAPAVRSTGQPNQPILDPALHPQGGSPAEAHGSTQVKSWLVRAQRNLSKKMDKFILIETIELLQRVLKVMPDQPEAIAAMQRAQRMRKQMVEEWMKIASDFFARQELEKAVPYYRDVLELQPGHLRALEGLQMYNRLKEIKNKNQ